MPQIRIAYDLLELLVGHVRDELESALRGRPPKGRGTDDRDLMAPLVQRLGDSQEGMYVAARADGGE